MSSDKLSQLKKTSGEKNGYTPSTGIVSTNKNQTKSGGLVARQTDVQGALRSLKRTSVSSNSQKLTDRMGDFTSMNKDKVIKKIEEERNKVEIVFLIDKSGSVRGTEEYFKAGYNEFIAREAAKKMETRVSSVLFDENQEIIHWREDIKNNPKIGYYVSNGGYTALYDTICNKIGQIKEDNLRGSGTKNTVVVIMTDGLDNISRHSIKDARDLISECIRLGWKFIFLGAKIESKTVAANLGIPMDMAEDFLMTANGIQTNFRVLNEALDALRETGKIPENWADGIKRVNAIGLPSGGPKVKRLTPGK